MDCVNVADAIARLGVDTVLYSVKMLIVTMKIFKTLLSFMLVAASFMTVSCGDEEDSVKPGFVGNDEFKVGKTEMALVSTAPQTLSIMAPVKPSVVADASWIHVSEMKATASGKVYSCDISCDANDTYDVRTGTLRVSSGKHNATVTVSQYGAETVRLVSVPPSQTLAPEGGSVTITYAATDEVEITAPDWLIETKSRALEEDKVAYSFSGNYSEAPRAGEVIVSLKKDPSVSISVNLTQEAAPKSDNMKSSARELAAKMYAGINIGNTMEVPGGETGWGNPKVNLTYIKGLKTLGFNAVRIPCAWDSHVVDATTNTIDPEWLDRVDEVVGWIVSEGMYAIVNIHWDGGWLEESCSNGYDEAVDKKQRDYWTQIAGRLNHYDEHLMFAGMNEPGMQNGLADKALDAIMKYQQTFLDAVRATGGNNASRCLIHQAPKTDINELSKGAYRLPADIVSDRALIEVHMYDPSDFTIMDKDGAWAPTVKYYWGAQFHVDGSDRNCTWGEESYIDGQFKKMKDNWASKGIPVIVGEYACQNQSASAKDIDFDRWKESRAYWTTYVTRAAKNAGCVPFYWETNGDINRNNGSAKNAYVIDAIMKGAAEGVYPF